MLLNESGTRLVLYDLLDTFLMVLMFAIIGRSLMSWFDRHGQNPVSRFLIQFTEPFVGPVRSVMPQMGMLDLSPMVTVFLIYMIRTLLRQAVTG